MYAKLHLPEGLVLEIRNLTGEVDFPCTAAQMPLTQAQQDYLSQCVRILDDPEATGQAQNQLLLQWTQTQTEAEKVWFRLHMANRAPAEDPKTPPPEWLVNYWTAERVYAVLSGSAPSKGEMLLPTQAGDRLWHLAKEMPAAKACIPGELVPGLPRLSWSMEWGWIAEYWYYYANAGLGFLLFTDPKYYLKVCLSTGQLLEVKNLKGELQFRQSWLDIWATWMYEKELDYLARCEQLMEKEDPTEEEVAQLQGLWLEAHPKEYAVWLAGNSHLKEAAIRWILSPDCVPDKEIFSPLWYGEMVKGVTLGAPDIAEQCINTLAAFGKNPVV